MVLVARETVSASKKMQNRVTLSMEIVFASLGLLAISMFLIHFIVLRKKFAKNINGCMSY